MIVAHVCVSSALTCVLDLWSVVFSLPYADSFSTFLDIIHKIHRCLWYVCMYVCMCVKRKNPLLFFSYYIHNTSGVTVITLFDSDQCKTGVASEARCVDFFPHTSDFLTPTCNSIQFWHELELLQTPQIKDSVPPDCPSLQIPITSSMPPGFAWLLSNLVTNQRFPWPLLGFCHLLQQCTEPRETCWPVTISSLNSIP